MMQTLSVREARRLALACAGLLSPQVTGFPQRAAGSGARARRAALEVIDRFGYLQLDTVSIAGARSHTIVLLSRLEGFDAALGEALLAPGQPLFEYWGHEASWLPLSLYPAFEFRRRDFKKHPWWGDVLREHRSVARDLRRRIADEGPLRSLDMEGAGSSGWWNLKVARRVASALWSSGELAIRERRGFQRSFDLTERVIPDDVRRQALGPDESMEMLAQKALDGHGWATTGTIVATWRLARRRADVVRALHRLVEAGRVIPCGLRDDSGAVRAGWITPAHRELAARLEAARPRSDRGVLLSPFDPLLWDRARVRSLFGFDQILEIFKPAAQRVYGYYCLPVLAGERLVARVDLKAERRERTLRVLSCRYEQPRPRGAAEAVRTAVARYSEGLRLRATGTA
jgi:uncharacterized protein YcaQ